MSRKVYESLHDAFWSNTDAGEMHECWLWKPLINRDRSLYPRIRFQGKLYGAHRLSYMLHHGLALIPAKMVVMHLCDTPPCVNPHHLQLGTQQENIQDAANKNRLHKCGFAKLTPTEVQEIRNLRGVMLYEDIAGAYAVSYWTIQAIMNGKRWSDVPDTGDTQHRKYYATRGKLTPALAREMRTLAATGEWSWKALGMRFDIGASAARAVCMGERWKDAGGPQPMPRGNKLTEQQAACVCHMYGCKSAAETAKQCGLSEVSVRDMWKGKIKKWAHLCAA